MPNGVYFSGDFSVTAWIHLSSFKFGSRVFEFGSGHALDNVFLAIYEKTNKLYASIYSSGEQKNVKSNTPIELNKWYSVALVFEGTEFSIYLNDDLDTSGQLIYQKEKKEQ